MESEKPFAISDLLNDLIKPEKKISFLAEIPCPMKIAFHDWYDHYESAYAKGEYASYLPTTCGLSNTEAGSVVLNQLRLEAIEKLPDVVISFGFREFFEQRLLDRWINPDTMQVPCSRTYSKKFQNLGLEDPLQVFTLFSSLPMVMVADKRHIGDLPLPHTWSDLLDPIYRGCISMPGSSNEPDKTPLLYYYRNFGEKGIQALAANTKQIESGFNVAQTAGSNRSNTAPIYLITWFFANACARAEDITLIIPEDGAFLNPVYLLARKNLSAPLSDLCRQLLSHSGLSIWEENYYPVVLENDSSKIPSEMTFQWLGWDFIREMNILDRGDWLISEYLHYWHDSQNI